MWHNHPFSQRNKATERAVGVRVGDGREGEVGQSLKKGGMQNRWWGIHKVGEVMTSLATMITLLLLHTLFYMQT